MASRKNRSGKTNRRSPKRPPGFTDRLRARFDGLSSWIAAHHWHSIVIAVVLMFIGVKMLLIDVYKIPVGFSLAVVAVIIGASVWASLRKETREKNQ